MFREIWKRLRAGYIASCEHHERRAEELRAERLKLKAARQEREATAIVKGRELHAAHKQRTADLIASARAELDENERLIQRTDDLLKR